MWLIAIGILKKALVADRLGILVGLCFGNAERAGSADLWLGIVAYGLQLYLDFSGYVDMARGSALLMVSRRTVSQGTVASVARLYHPGARYRLVGRFSV